MDAYNILNLPAGQYYIQVLTTNFASFGSNYNLMMNARYDNVAVVWQHDAAYSRLVYLNHTVGGSVHVNGTMMGAFWWEDGDEGTIGTTTMFGYYTRAMYGKRLSVSKVGVYQQNFDYYHNTIRIGVEDVYYRYYKSSVTNGHLTVYYDATINTKTQFPQAQPTMYYIFDAITGECIAFDSPNMHIPQLTGQVTTNFEPYE